MRNKAISSYITLIGTVLSINLIVLFASFGSGEIKDIFLNFGFAIFSASCITFIISIFEYRNIKRNLTLQFCYECEEFIEALYSIDYVNIGAHEVAVSKYMQLEKLIESDDKESKECLKSILDEDSEWSSKDLKSYKIELCLYKPSFDQRIRQSMQSYLKLGTFNSRIAEMVLNDINFIFNKKNKKLYEQALTIMKDSLDCVKKHSEFFKNYLSNRIGQQSQVVEHLAKANSFFFDIKKNDKFTTADEKISLELKNAVDSIKQTVFKNRKCK